jgi:membrane protein
MNLALSRDVRWQAAFEIVREALSQFWSEGGPRMAAALAFYTLFSLAPTLIIAVAAAGMIFGHDVAQERVVAQVENLIGIGGADVVDALIATAREPSSSVPATTIGLIALLLGASGVFGEIQAALNTVWNVAPRPERAIVAFVKRRFVSFAMVFGTGFLLLVSLVVSTALTAVADWGARVSSLFVPALRLVDLGVSLIVITILFALTYRLVPDVRLAWRDVWLGAAVTSALFVAGKFALGLYLGGEALDSPHALIGSMLGLVLWVYYSSQILLFGAELTQVWSMRRGRSNGLEPPLEAWSSRAGTGIATSREQCLARHEETLLLGSRPEMRSGP